MSERTSYVPGTPCWVDLGTPDIEAAAAFYGGLFGWSIEESENAEQTGGYRQAELHDKPVCGVMPLMQEGQPPAWATYVSVEDAAATTAAVREAGGNVLVEPMAVMDLGTMAVFSDPTGAVFGIWQPGTFAGAGLVNEYGTLGWNELNTRDTAAAKEFYGAVFGWGSEEEDSEIGGTYTIWKLGDAVIGGMIDLGTIDVPAEVPAHWLSYFAVEDADAVVEKVKDGGGGLMSGPIDVRVGRLAVLSDPSGATFAVNQPTEEVLANAP